MSKDLGIGPQKLLELRLKANKTQEEVAEAVEVRDHTVRNWEKGRSVPRLTIRQVKALCRILDCSLDDLPDEFL
ncbi:MAG: helix-turn-helix transcriptional regulator [Cyanothece sp. SIO1E1]|nr:helix-turn-helix transcriptional regulator [Cyanothece sp. SIO1E1]